MKNTVETIWKPILFLFKKSLNEGKLPSQWKHANVCAIFKSGNKELVNNYRPISLTSNICKMCERLICNKLTAHLTENDLICSSQHGFLLEFITFVGEAYDTGENIDVFILTCKKHLTKCPMID